MIECPKCHRTERQNRAGKTEAGSQRYRCMFCQAKYTPQPKPRAYPAEVRRKALQLYVDGMNLRRIARHLGIHHRTVSLWVRARAAQLPDPPVPEQVKEAEMDELFTFIGDKKTKSSSSVEGDNAELRHYLARLARRSRCPEALTAALKLFMYCFNRRQLDKQRFPNYPAHVYQFI